MSCSNSTFVSCLFVPSVIALTYGCSSADGADGADAYRSEWGRTQQEECTKKKSSASLTSVAPHGPLRVATFNAELAPSLAPLVPERKPYIVQAMAQLSKSLDVACVQEFWLDSDFAMLANAVREHLPNALRRAPRPGTGSCAPADLESLGQCLQSHCAALSGSDQIQCAELNCSTEVVSLSPGCLGCVLNNVDSDLSACAGPDGPADPAIYGGSFDVGLLSRYPFTASEVTKELDSYFVRMAVLYAKLEMPDGKPIHAFCTHLGSPLDIVPYAGNYGSWEDEHLHQVLQLRDYINQKAAPGERVVLLGDLNTGPNGEGLVGEWASNYTALIGDDLFDPYYDSPRVDCTWCPENNLAGSASSRKLIDHVLIRGFDEKLAHVSRVFDAPVRIQVSGSTLSVNLSDHYGLLGRIEK